MVKKDGCVLCDGGEVEDSKCFISESEEFERDRQEGQEDCARRGVGYCIYEEGVDDMREMVSCWGKHKFIVG